MQLSRYARWIALAGYLGVAVGVVAWFEWLAPSAVAGHWITLCLLLPLIFPARGMLRARPYTYAWSSLLSLPYLGLALSELLVTPEKKFAVSLVLYPAAAWFIGSIMYVRWLAQEKRRDARQPSAEPPAD